MEISEPETAAVTASFPILSTDLILELLPKLELVTVKALQFTDCTTINVRRRGTDQNRKKNPVISHSPTHSDHSPCPPIPSLFTHSSLRLTSPPIDGNSAEAFTPRPRHDYQDSSIVESSSRDLIRDYSKSRSTGFHYPPYCSRTLRGSTSPFMLCFQMQHTLTVAWNMTCIILMDMRWKIGIKGLHLTGNGIELIKCLHQ